MSDQQDDLELPGMWSNSDFTGGETDMTDSSAFYSKFYSSDKLTIESCVELLKQHGGSVHGPNIETVSVTHLIDVHSKWPQPVGVLVLLVSPAKRSLSAAHKQAGWPFIRALFRRGE